MYIALMGSPSLQIQNYPQSKSECKSANATLFNYRSDRILENKFNLRGKHREREMYSYLTTNQSR